MVVGIAYSLFESVTRTYLSALRAAGVATAVVFPKGFFYCLSRPDAAADDPRVIALASSFWRHPSPAQGLLLATPPDPRSSLLHAALGPQSSAAKAFGAMGKILLSIDLILLRN